MSRKLSQREVLIERSSPAARALQAKLQAVYMRSTMSNDDGTCKRHNSQLYDECECDKRVNVFMPKYGEK